MSERQFVYAKKNGAPSKPVGLRAVMAVALLRTVIGGGPFDLTQDGEALRQDVSRKIVLDRLKTQLEHGEVGPAYRVRNPKKVVFSVRETKPAWEVIDTNGNDKADAAWGAVKMVFPKVRFLGAYVCKYIAGSNNLSQHSYGNALDIGAGSMAELERIADWFQDHSEEFHLEHIIVNRSIWTHGVGWRYYGGDTHYHVHLDFTPSQFGSCGVKG
jgi:hypothetical protein